MQDLSSFCDILMVQTELDYAMLVYHVNGAICIPRKGQRNAFTMQSCLI